MQHLFFYAPPRNLTTEDNANPGSNVVEVASNAEWTPPAPQPALLLPKGAHQPAQRLTHEGRPHIETFQQCLLGTNQIAEDHTQPGSNLVEVKDSADWTPPPPQPVEIPSDSTSGASDRALDIKAGRR